MEAFCVDVGLAAFAEALEAEVEEVCEPRGRCMGHGERRHTRYGTARGSVVVGPRRLEIMRPRVRAVGEEAGEIRLKLYQAASQGSLMEEAVIGALWRGVSRRG